MSETPGVPSQPGSAQLERLQQLDRRIAQTVGQLIGSLQEEVDRRLSEATGELQRLFEKMKPAAPDLPGAFLQPEDLSELMPPAPPPVSVEVPVPVPVRVSLNESLAPLLAGLARIDGESGQATILKALLEEAQRFASRAGFVLIRGGEIRGWAAQDLPEATLQATNFASLGGPFTRLLSADGTVVLSAEECGQVAGSLGVEAATAGVLVPFQIRGQLAGALYADRLGNDEELGVAGLQVLAYGAAQALETSQLRKGSSSALRLGAGEQLPEPPAAPATAPAPAIEMAAAVAVLAVVPAVAAPVYSEPEPAYEAPAAYQPEPAAEPEYAADAYDPTGIGQESAAPAYEAPAYEAPAYEAASYQAPAEEVSYPYPAEPEPSYAAPSYETPSYETPSSYEAPAYEAPSYEAPSYPAPSHETFEAPAGEAPAYEAPAYEAASYEAPSYEPPAMETPSFATPAYEPPAYEPSAFAAPSYEAPSYEVPSYEPPTVETPSYSYEAPAYEPPAYEASSFEAPSYEAPAYEAPAYEAPAYPAPSYEAPAYDAPSYEAPSVASPSYDISYPSSFDAPAAPAYEAPSYEAPAYEPPAYEAPAYEAASYEVPGIEPASFEMVPDDAPTTYEVSYEAASYEVTYEPASEPSSFDTTFEPAATDDGYAANEDVRFTREPAYELPSEEEIARENQPEPALEDTNIWEAEEDDEPTQIGQSTAAVPQQLETPPPAAPVAPPVGLGQQTVRLDISQLQSHATQLAQERYGDDTADVSPPAASAWSPPAPAAPAYAPTYSPPSFATPEPAYGGGYDQSEAPTMLGRSAMPAAPAPPPSPATFAPPAATEQAPGGFGAGGFGAGEAKEPGGSTEVRPPADLVGPGRAFAAQAAGPRGGGGGGVEESLREEARRLARLLVSEIKLYNEEIIEEGRRSGNIYDRLKDDIDRSRQMYEERIDPRLTDQEDYFYQELVQRLAGGDAKLLGL